MTGCLYASPEFEPGNPQAGVLPVLMADTMATFDAPPPDAKAIIPATFTAPGSSTVRLRRKLHIIDPAALACSGFEFAIKEFLGEMEKELPARIVDLAKPMRWVGDAANFQNNKYRRGLKGRDALGVLGCTKARDGRFNTVAARDRFETRWFGICAAVGSGSADLKELCQAFDNSFKLPPGSIAWDRALGLASAVNSDRLAREIMGVAENGWGGYVEWAYFDTGTGRWRRGPKTLNLFYIAQPDEHGVYSFGLIERAIAYDPGGQVGRIMSLHADPQIRPVEFLLQPLTDAVLPDEADPTKFWTGWRPDVCTVTLIVEKPQGAGLRFVTKSLLDELLPNVVLQYSPTTRNFGVRQPYLNELMAEFFDAMGVRHRPMEQSDWVTPPTDR